MKFLVIGHFGVIKYKDIFPLFKNGEIWLGASGRNFYFDTDEGEKHINAAWWTNIQHDKQNKPLELTKKYSPQDYQKYDNFNAIEVGMVKDIPCNFDGVMGVPITFLDKYCPEQFEIVGVTVRWSPDKIKRYTEEDYPNFNDLNGSTIIIVNGVPKMKFTRILIKKRK